jgi:AraC-like DNA-binding protein
LQDWARNAHDPASPAAARGLPSSSTMRTDETFPADPVHEALQCLARAAAEAAPADGMTATIVPFLSVLRQSAPTALRNGILRPSICLVVQGRKRFHLGEDAVEYGAGRFLAASIDLPAGGEVTGATRTRPYIAVRLEIEPSEVAHVLMESKLTARPGDTVGPAFVGDADAETVDAFRRLLVAAGDTRDAAFLAPALKREIIYRLLTGPSGQMFLRSVTFDPSAIGVGKAIRWLRENFDRPFKVDDLAKVARMSVSSLHHKFKGVTTMGPLQYQKRLRLEEARRRLLSGTVDATGAAFGVGYESASQFSREYRRLFGLPPSRDVKAFREKPARATASSL